MGRNEDQEIEYAVVLLDRMEPGLQAIESGQAGSWSPSDITSVLSETTNALNATASVADSVTGIVQCIAGTAQAMVEVSASIRKLEIEADRSLRKLDRMAPLLEKEISRAADKVDRLMEATLNIDPTTCSDRLLDLRERQLDTAMRLSTQVSDLLMKYMSI